MKEFPHLELRRSDLRNQANSIRTTIGYSSDTAGSRREEMFLELLTGELRELDYVLTYFSRPAWSWWQWGLLAAIALLSLAAGGVGAWMLISG